MTTLTRLEHARALGEDGLSLDAACAATGLDPARLRMCRCDRLVPSGEALCPSCAWTAARLLPKRRPAPSIPHDAHGPGPAHSTSVGAWARSVRLAGRGA